MSTQIAKRETPSEDFFTDEMSNEEYHKPDHGLSTSTIKMYMDDPAEIIWSRNAPQNKDKLKAADFGTDFHAYMLELEYFTRQYQVLPVFNRRKKEEKQAELDLIDEWREKGITTVTAEVMEQLHAMKLSAMAHPTVKAIMALDGVAERSFFWTDPETGIRCKCRPDWLVTGIHGGNRPYFMPSDCDTLIMDIKSIGRFDQIESQVEKLRYFIQDAFYTRGVEQVLGGKVCFAFAFVSSTLSLGRHPVAVAVMADTARLDGNREIDKALAGYAQIQASGDKVWQTAITLDRPMWATRDEDLV